jgi:hypothetical protein
MLAARRPLSTHRAVRLMRGVGREDQKSPSIPTPAALRASTRTGCSQSIDSSSARDTNTCSRSVVAFAHWSAKDENGHCPGSSPRTASQSWIASAAGEHYKLADTCGNHCCRSGEDGCGAVPAEWHCRTVAHGVLIMRDKRVCTRIARRQQTFSPLPTSDPVAQIRSSSFRISSSPTERLLGSRASQLRRPKSPQCEPTQP